MKIKTLVCAAALGAFVAAPVGAFFESAPEDKPVNVLCYHRFKARKITDEKKKKWGDPYAMTPEQFEEQMQWLKDNGYNVIPMKKYVEYLYGKGTLPDKPVVITIDDGYECTYSKAYPILKKFGYPAAIYLYKSFIPGGKNALTFDNVKEMMKDGLEVGIHSNTHSILTRKDKGCIEECYKKKLEKEIIEPKEYLEKKLGVAMDTFSYPYGTYSKETRAIVAKAGYRAAFSVVASYNTKDTDIYSLKRTMMMNTTTVDKLKRILEKKPLKLSELYPADGDIITDRTPELKAVLVDDSKINTATIKFKMGTVLKKESVYNPETKVLTYYYKDKLPMGTHVAKVVAEGKEGGEHEYAWLFIIGRPTKMNLLEGGENGVTDDVKEEEGNGKK